MITKYEKANKGKLLVAVLALAMIVAGAAVVFSDSTVDAASEEISGTAPTLVSGTEVTLANEGIYYATSDITITDDGTGTVTLYLVNGASAKFPSTVDSTVTVYAATDGNSTAAPQNRVAGLSVVAVANAVIENDNGVLTVTKASTSTSTFGVSVNKGTTDGITYYGAGANIGAVSLENGDIVTVKDGSAIVSQGTNRMTIDGTSTKGFIVTGVASNAYPTITGQMNAGAFTVNSGVFVSNDSDNITANLNAVSSGSANNWQYANQVRAIEGAQYVRGIITQTTNVGTATNAVSITIGAGSTYTINTGINAYANVSMSSSGVSTLNLYGNLYGGITAGGTDDIVNIGPDGYTNATFSNMEVNNTLAGNVYRISGELEKSETVTNVLLDNDLIIPKGMTLTVTGNLGLNGYQITVEGTLDISNRGVIFGTTVNKTTEGIALADGGVISNNGVIGKNFGVKILSDSNSNSTATITGTSGAEFGTTTVNGTEYLTVTGNLAAISSSKADVKSIELANVYLSGDVNVANGATIEVGTGVKMLRNATLAINGTATGTSATITMDNGCSVTVNGLMDGVSITAPYGVVGEGSVVVGATSSIISFTPVNGSDEVTYVTGLTVSISRVTVPQENADPIIEQRVYVSGSLGATTVKGSATNASSSLGIGITSQVYVAADTSLVYNAGGTGVTPVALTGGAKYYVSGTIQINGDANVNTITNYEGASYTVSTTGANATYTTYYTTLDAALAAIDTADQKTINVNVPKIENSIDVVDGQTLNLVYSTGNGLTIGEDAVITAENGGTITGNVGLVDGMLVQAPEGMVPTPASYVSTWTDEDGTVTYSGLGPALANAPEGSTVTIGSAETEGALTVSNGITLAVTGTLRIGGNLTIAEGATVTGGNIVFYKTATGSSTATATINGTLDLSNGTASVDGKTVTVTTPGTTIGIGSPNGINISGAQYTNTDGDVVTTSVANAAAYAAENEVSGVNIIGNVSESGDVSFDGVNVTVNGTVRLGNVTINNANISVQTGELTATVLGLSGEGDAAANAGVTLSRASATVTSTVTVNAAGANVCYMSVNPNTGSVTISQGTVRLATGDETVNGENSLTVASGAVLEVRTGAILNVDNDKVTVDGTVDIIGGIVDVETNGVLTVNGTVTIRDGGQVNVNAGKMAVTGTVDVTAQDNYDNRLTVTSGYITLGTEATTIGAPGAIVGKVTFTSAGAVIAFAGADVSATVFCDSTGAELEEDYSTEFYINGGLYMTAYADGATLDNVLDVPEFKITGYDVTLTNIQNDDNWRDVDGETLTVANVGEIDAIYYEVSPAKAFVQYSAGSQISLYVDGVKVNSGSTVELTVGTHTVEATVNPGYTGDVTITFNGQTVNGTFEVTPEMSETATTAQSAVVLSALGSISVDGASTGSSDGGMGIVEILLVILVVVVVILAIIVVLRMMRS